MKNLLIAILSVLFITTATQALANNTELTTEVIGIHDVAMAKMTQMHELRLQLQAVEKKSGASPETTKAMVDLQNAHKGMMKWMHKYKAPQNNAEYEPIRQYLLKEKVKIQKVSDDIDASISNATKLLDSLPK